jgi:isomerase DpgB
MSKPTGERAKSLTLPTGDLAYRARVLTDFIRSKAGGLAVLDLRQAQHEHLAPGDGIHDVNHWERALHLIEQSSAATVALFGHEVGGSALEVGLACNFRIAGPRSQVVWRNAGAVWPSMALFRLVRLIGPAKTTRLTVLGEPLAADAALINGLVDIITDDPETEVDRLRTALAGLQDFRLARQLVTEATSATYDDALGAHLAACERYLRQREAAR